MTATPTSMSNFVTTGDIRARVRWMKEALGELEDELDRVEKLIDELSGGERDQRGMEPLIYGRIWGDFSFSRGRRRT